MTVEIEHNIKHRTDDIQLVTSDSIAAHLAYSKRQLWSYVKYAGVTPDFDNWDDLTISEYIQSQRLKFTSDGFGIKYETFSGAKGICEIEPQLSLDNGKDFDDIAIESNCMLTIYNHYKQISSFPRWRDILAVVATYHLITGDLDHNFVEDLINTGVDTITGLPIYEIILGS